MHTEEYVRNFLNEQGCQLLGPYIANKAISYRCSCGRISKIQFCSFKRGRRCKECGIEKCAAKRRLSQAHVENVFKTQGLELLDEYTGNRDILRYKCRCGEIATITYTNLVKDYQTGCPACAKKSRAECFKHSAKYVKNYFKEHGCTLTSTDYANTQQLLDYICVCGRQAKISFSHFRSGKRCKQCAIDNQRAEKSHFWNPDREKVNLRRRIAKKYYAMLRITLTKTSATKTCKSQEMLGYTNAELIRHIELCENYHLLQNQKWSLDHIFPIMAFIKYSITSIQLINCLDNLQPLTKNENSRKSDCYNEEEFLKWLERKWLEYKTTGSFNTIARKRLNAFVMDAPTEGPSELECSSSLQ